jgi:hypothetical protein
VCLGKRGVGHVVVDAVVDVVALARRALPFLIVYFYFFLFLFVVNSVVNAVALARHESGRAEGGGWGGIRGGSGGRR